MTKSPEKTAPRRRRRGAEPSLRPRRSTRLQGRGAARGSLGRAGSICCPMTAIDIEGISGTSPAR